MRKIFLSTCITFAALSASVTISFVLIFILSSVFLNVIDKDRILPNIYLQESYIGLQDVKDVRVEYQAKAIKSLPSTIKLTIGSETKEYPTSDLSPELYLQEVQDVGRNSNIIRAMEELGSVSSPIRFEYEYKFNVEKIISEFKMFNNEDIKFFEDDGRVVGCTNDLSTKLVDVQKVSKTISENLRGDVEVKLDKSQILSEGVSTDLYLICNKFKHDSNIILSKFQRFGDVKIEEVLSFVGLYMSSEGSLLWRVYDNEKLQKFLVDLKARTTIVLDEGQYEESGGTIRLFSQYKEGKELDLEASYNNIVKWSSNPTASDFKIVYKVTSPWYIRENKTIADFTYELGRGESRLNYNIDNGRVGVEEINGYVLNPGSEYSFYNMLEPRLQDIWRTKNGRPIEMGICSSSTTIFRAALHAGFPITERASHGWSLPKYSWPYEQNVVDATYLTTPKIDLKFINDLSYPVMFKSETWVQDGWEYQRVRILTSPKAKGRSVELGSFRKWDERLPGIYKGSFDRIIKENGVEKRRDYFESNYYMYAPY
jgi:vancomycin resistance protein YoaR